MPQWAVITCAIIAFAAGGYAGVMGAWEQARQGRFDIDFLMIAAAFGAALIGDWPEGALLLFLFTLSGALETFALRGAAEEYKGTDGGAEAAKYATEIEDFIKGRQVSNAAFQAAIKQATADLKKAANDAVAAAEAKRAEPLAAEAALDEGAKALKALLDKKYEDGRGLVSKAEHEGEVARLDALRTSLASAVESAGEAVRKAAGEAAAGGSAVALDKAIALLDAFVASHPQTDGTGVIATAWNAASAAVAGDRAPSTSKALLADFLADRGSRAGSRRRRSPPSPTTARAAGSTVASSSRRPRTRPPRARSRRGPPPTRRSSPATRPRRGSRAGCRACSRPASPRRASRTRSRAAAGAAW
jgi:hypothetical protein